MDEVTDMAGLPRWLFLTLFGCAAFMAGAGSVIVAIWLFFGDGSTRAAGNPASADGVAGDAAQDEGPAAEAPDVASGSAEEEACDVAPPAAMLNRHAYRDYRSSGGGAFFSEVVTLSPGVSLEVTGEGCRGTVSRALVFKIDKPGFALADDSSWARFVRKQLKGIKFTKDLQSMEDSWAFKGLDAFLRKIPSLRPLKEQTTPVHRAFGLCDNGDEPVAAGCGQGTRGGMWFDIDADTVPFTIAIRRSLDL
ncbi:MAG: hypothetical protein HZB91_14075 [Elusimicrobia bacterium]|nr:hypothetical protein [Elusimicrobiota bacterium]